MNLNNSFLFVSQDIEFEETDKGAIIVATVLELEKSSANNRLYKIDEGEQIALSLEGKPVYYGIDPTTGRHDNPIMRERSKATPVGFVETAKVLGNRIKAVIRILNQSLVQKLKSGKKFLFSVGGHAISETLKNIGGKIVHVLEGAKCNHLQIVDSNVSVGFPNAELEKVLEINETVMLFGNEELKTIKVEEYIEEDVELTGRSIVGYEEE